MLKQRPLKYLSDLPEQKQHEIFSRLERGTSYQKVQEHLLQPAPLGVGAKVSISTLQRFYARGCAKNDLECRTGQQENASAWLKWAAQGDASGFDTAALEIIKLRAFQLAETMADAGEIAQLKNLFAILLAVRLVEVRKRNMAVQERLLAVREVEAEVRRLRLAALQLQPHPREPAGPEKVAPMPRTDSLQHRHVLIKENQYKYAA